MESNLKEFVHHRGKIWINTGRRDHLRRLILTNWMDSSLGTIADADMVYNCTDEEIEIIKSLLKDPDEMERIREAQRDAEYEEKLKIKQNPKV